MAHNPPPPRKQPPDFQVTETLLAHAKVFYNALLAKSEWDNELKAQVFTGRVSHTYKETGISAAHYSKVQVILDAAGSWQRLTRGNRETPSRVILIREPSRESLPEEMLPNLLTGAGSLARMRQQMDDLAKQARGVDIPAALRNHENRIAALEERIEQMFASLPQ